jgi:hypothetical protein
VNCFVLAARAAGDESTIMASASVETTVNRMDLLARPDIAILLASKRRHAFL